MKLRELLQPENSELLIEGLNIKKALFDSFFNIKSGKDMEVFLNSFLRDVVGVGQYMNVNIGDNANINAVADKIEKYFRTLYTTAKLDPRFVDLGMDNKGYVWDNSRSVKNDTYAYSEIADAQYKWCARVYVRKHNGITVDDGKAL